MGSNKDSRGQRTVPPGPVREWADQVRGELAYSPTADLADHQIAAAANLAEEVHAQARESRLSRAKRRGRFIISTFISTWIGKVMTGMVAVAAATGGAAAAGVDLPSFIPFVGADETTPLVEVVDEAPASPGQGTVAPSVEDSPAEFEAAIAQLEAEYLSALAGIATERAALDTEKQAEISDAQADYDEAVAGIAIERAALDTEKQAEISDAQADYDEAVAGIAIERAALDAEKQAEISDTTRWIDADLRELESELGRAKGGDRREIQREIDALLRERDAELAGIEQDFADEYTDLDTELAGIEAEYRSALAGVEQDFAEEYTDLDTELAGIEAEYRSALAGVEQDFAAAYADLDDRLARVDADYLVALEALGTEYETANRSAPPG